MNIPHKTLTMIIVVVIIISFSLMVVGACVWYHKAKPRVQDPYDPNTGSVDLFQKEAEEAAKLKKQQT